MQGYAADKRSRKKGKAHEVTRRGSQAAGCLLLLATAAALLLLATAAALLLLATAAPPAARAAPRPTAGSACGRPRTAPRPPPRARPATASGKGVQERQPSARPPPQGRPCVSVSIEQSAVSGPPGDGACTCMCCSQRNTGGWCVACGKGVQERQQGTPHQPAGASGKGVQVGRMAGKRRRRCDLAVQLAIEELP